MRASLVKEKTFESDIDLQPDSQTPVRLEVKGMEAGAKRRLDTLEKANNAKTTFITNDTNVYVIVNGRKIHLSKEKIDVYIQNILWNKVAPQIPLLEANDIELKYLVVDHWRCRL